MAMGENNESLSCSLNRRERLLQKSVFLLTGTKCQSLFCVTKIKRVKEHTEIQHEIQESQQDTRQIGDRIGLAMSK
jgi:hypothetical protein